MRILKKVKEKSKCGRRGVKSGVVKMKFKVWLQDQSVCVETKGIRANKKQIQRGSEV